MGWFVFGIAVVVIVAIAGWIGGPGPNHCPKCAEYWKNKNRDAL